LQPKPTLFILLIGLLKLSSCQRHICPAYSSVDERVKKSYTNAKQKKLNRKNDALFTKEQMQVIRSGKGSSKIKK
jgi:hypothetical protein